MATPIPWQPRGVVQGAALQVQAPAGRFAPDPVLAGFVEHFWWVSWDLRGRASAVRETLPHPSIHIVIEEGSSGIAGISTARFSRKLSGHGRVLGIKFLPGLFRPFWPVACATLTNRVLPLNTAFAAAGDQLIDDVLACGDQAAAAVAVAERFLLKRVPPFDPQANLARTVVTTIRESTELTEVEAVAQRMNLGRRFLQRLFHDYVGVGPKWVIRRYRLHEAMARLESGDGLDLAALAVELGYCDQAHFTRDFKALVGATPERYARMGK